MIAVPTATLDRDDLAQVRAIARWKAETSYRADASWAGRSSRGWVAMKVTRSVIDAVRLDTGHRNAVPRPRLVHAVVDQPEPTCPIDRLVDRLTVAQVVSRLSQDERCIVEATVLGEQTIADWAREHGFLHEKARRLRLRALHALSATPEIAALRGTE